jgi:DNA-binding NarL/FixJ family response regulator
MHGQVVAGAFKRSNYHFVIEACEIDSKGALAAIEMKQPHVAVISSDLRDGHSIGFNVVRQVRVTHSKTNTVLLLESSDPGLVVNAFRSGARGVFCRESSFSSLCKCVYVVSRGQLWATSEQLRNVMDAFAEAAPPHVVDWKGDNLLTKREDEVVRLIVEGMNTREISERLNLTSHTVRNYLYRIYEKLGIFSRVELVLYATNRNRVRERIATNEELGP